MHSISLLEYSSYQYSGSYEPASLFLGAYGRWRGIGDDGKDCLKTAVLVCLGGGYIVQEPLNL